MNIRYLKHQQIDKKQWDTLIESSPQGQVYALSWYLDIVAPNWEAVVLLGTNAIYTAVMPLPNFRKIGIRYIKQPFFCQQLGVFSKEEHLKEEVYNLFLNEIKHRYRLIINYQFNTANHIPLSSQLSLTYTHYLDLSPPYERITSKYTRDRKMNLKRACKAEIQLHESNDIEPLISFFKTETANKIYGGVSDESYDQLRRLCIALQERDLARLIYSTDSNGTKNAGCLFIIWQSRIIYIFNASDSQGRKLNGRTLILDWMFRQYAGKNFIFDFESPSEKEQNILHFYRSFGPQKHSIQVLNYNRLPKAIKIIRSLRIQAVRGFKSKV